MNEAFRDHALAERVETARRLTLDWLATLDAPGEPPGVSLISAAHDPARWPSMLLPGTYNALMCRDLLGGLDDLSAAERAGLAHWLLGFRRDDGVFRLPQMTDATVYKKDDRAETWRYIDFHVTNYSLGAVQAVAPERAAVLDFARPYLDPLVLKAWLADRDLRDPWQEGNNIVNLASFLLLMREAGDHVAAVDRALDILFAWHDRLQEPETGFWGVGQGLDPLRRLHAMAGSMHNFHIWYRLGRPLPYQDRAVDYALSRPTGIDSACIDVDLVDLLVHAHGMIPHRRRDTVAWLREKLAALLAFQSADGGFMDEPAGVRRQDGWVGGYAEPQGLSNTFATWFRWIAIAMIADLLWPGRWPWRFRRMIGIGYRGPVRP
jgi:hypothetical protein